MARSEWAKIRAFDGSQETAFEALCKQLAGCESYAADAEFIPKGNPDTGIECFWKLGTGEEHGWQAKFFLASPQASQWRQLDESVKSALAKHAQLRRYTVCLPIDLPDARVQDTHSARQQWDKHVVKWKSWARGHGHDCEFVYWGDHELHSRLINDQHRGRYRYFFNKEIFTETWFEQHLAAQIQAAGARYTPELHIDIDLSKTFGGAVRGPYLADIWYGHMKDFTKAAKDLRFYDLNKSLRREGERLQSACQASLDRMLALRLNMPHRISDAGISPDLELLHTRIDKLVDRLRRSAQRFEKKTTKPYTSTPYERAQGSLWGLHREVDEIQNFLQGELIQLANGRPLLIRGDAGTGKTHALCDFAVQHREVAGHSIICFGTQFRDDALLPQVCRRLGLVFGNWDEFFGALSAVAEYHGHPAVLCLDALNEATGAHVWEHELPALFTALKRYPWVRLFLSVRTPMEDLFVPEHIASKCVSIQHAGFGEHYIKAAAKFFDYYDLEGLRAPPLVPELQNPLFLKLYCKAHKGASASELVGGTRSLQRLFDRLIEHTQEELGKRGIAGIDPRGNEIAKALEQIAERMIDSGSDHVPREDAKQIVEAKTSSAGRAFKESPFAYLIQEGLLREVPFYEHGEDRPTQAIAFGYQRFTDYLLAECLVKRHVNPTKIKCAFQPGAPLVKWLCDQASYSHSIGVYTMLAIITAERFGTELPSLLSDEDNARFDSRLHLESIVWRSPRAVPASLASWVVKNALQADSNGNCFLETLLTLALTPDHPLNARTLHQHLIVLEMPERDVRWTMPMQHSQRWGHDGPFHTLLHWAWAGRYRTHEYLKSCAPDAAELGATLLFWCFTFSDRALRDSATKAAVDLLSVHPDQLPSLIHAFGTVDDLYVSERVSAVALGVGTRIRDPDLLLEVLDAIYTAFFSKRDPPANYLFRDYTRRLVELAARRHSNVPPHLQQMARPQQVYLRRSPASLDELDQRFKTWYDTSIGYVALSGSIKHGDFIHYVARLPHGAHKRLRRRKGTRKGIDPQRINGPDFVKRWLLERVAQLGWTPKRFNRHDQSNRSNGRMTHTSERIGKKYQWIAWRELVARCYDTYEIVIDEDSWGGEESEDSLWLFAARADIDPTITAYESGSEAWGDAQKAWWSQVEYDAWLPDSRRTAWLRRINDIPDTKSLLTVKRPETGADWLIASGWYRWTRKEALAITPKEEIFYQMFLGLRGYLVKRRDKTKLTAWARQQRFLGDWMPGGHEVGRYSGAYLGEYPEQPDVVCAWAEPGPSFRGSNLPCAMLPLTWSYLCERGYDNSICKAINLDLLCPFIARSEGLQHFSGDGRLHTPSGELVAEDPSIDALGPSTLVMHRDWLQSRVLRDEYLIFWTVIGEKNANKIGGSREYIGHRELNGYYLFEGSRITGKVRTEFLTPAMMAQRHQQAQVSQSVVI